MIKEYIERLHTNRGFASGTVSNYERTMKMFDKYLKKLIFKGVEECEDIKVFHIEGFIKEQRLKGKDPNTCNNYLASIRMFLKFCLIIGKKVEDYRKILYIRTQSKKIEALTDDECKRLFEYFRNVPAKNDRQELIKTRNLMICSLLLYTGLRVNELANLKIEDIKEEIQIIGKGGVRRVVYLFEEQMRLVNLYLFLRKDNNEYLCISHSNYSKGHLSTVFIEEIIRKGGENIGIKVFPHMLRHTFATQLLRNNANIVHIQRLLGHKNIATTQGYLTVLNCEIKETQKLIPQF